MNALNITIRTLVPSVAALTVVGAVIAILNTNSIGEKLYTFLSRRRRSILIFLALLILAMPAVFSLLTRRALSLQDGILYIKEVLLSVLFILSFVATWILLHNSRTIWHWLAVHLHIDIPKVQRLINQEDVLTQSGGMYTLREGQPMIHSSSSPTGSRRVVSHVQNSPRTDNLPPAFPKRHPLTGSPRNGGRIYDPGSAQAAASRDALLPSMLPHERAVGQDTHSSVSERRSPRMDPSSNHPAHKSRSSGRD